MGYSTWQEPLDTQSGKDGDDVDLCECFERGEGALNGLSLEEPKWLAGLLENAMCWTPLKEQIHQHPNQTPLPSKWIIQKLPLLLIFYQFVRPFLGKLCQWRLLRPGTGRFYHTKIIIWNNFMNSFSSGFSAARDSVVCPTSVPQSASRK